MKEKILNEILCCHERLVNLPGPYKKMLATEIDTLTHEHYMKFVEWKDSDDCPFTLYIGLGHIRTYEREDSIMEYTLEEIYQYWLTQIR